MRDVTVSRIISIGAGKHSKLLLQKDGTSVFGMYFGVGSSALGFEVGDKIDILFNIDINDFRNVRSVQLIIEDACISRSYTNMMNAQKQRYEEIKNGDKYDESEDIIPQRSDFVQVYTVLRREFRSGTSVLDVDDLLKLVNASDDIYINYIKLMYIIRILNEMKVCRIENMSEYEGEHIFKFDVYFNASKVNIEKSSILKKLKSQCRDRTKF
jgi:single-stranded-DNA-specific exonuclease